LHANPSAFLVEILAYSSKERGNQDHEHMNGGRKMKQMAVEK
jgi:hypothetical protein